MPDRQPLLSVIVPTYNSARTLRATLESVARQNIDRTAVEVLVIDGGSSDATLAIAGDYGCEIVPNPFVQPEHAKSLGIQRARGRFALFLDSDEVLCRNDSLQKKIEVLTTHPNVRNIVTAGLKTPPGYPFIAEYTNCYGEPFSYFMHRLDGSDYVRSLANRYGIAYEDESVLVVAFGGGDALPICDGGGHCFDLEFLKSACDISDPQVVGAIFPIMAEHSRHLAVVKDDYTLHHATLSLRRYINKLNWRVIANVHAASGSGGFVKREALAPGWFGLKKYLFIPYAFTLVGPLIDAMLLCVKHRRAGFLAHLPLSFYTAAAILYQTALKTAGVRRELKAYGSG